MKTRRFLAFLLALTMTSTMIPATAFAEPEPEEAVEAVEEIQEEVQEEETEEIPEEIEETEEVIFEELDPAGEGSGEEEPEEEIITPVTAKVSFTSQAANAFLHAPAVDVEVSSDLAESYGYTDGTPAGTAVSALDVMVAAHELVFGEDFTAETAAELLTVSAAGYVSCQFGTPGYNVGFALNDATPNDGTESSYGGYNGTTLSTTAVADGDTLAFYSYVDASFYSDQYNWLEDANGYSRTFEVEAGQDLTLTMKSVMIMMGYMYQNRTAMVAAGAEAPDVQLYTVDMETGALTPIEGAVTSAADDENDIPGGDVTLNFAEAGTYYVAGLATEDCDDSHLLTITQINVTEPEPVEPVEATVSFTSQAAGAFLHAPAVDLEVSSDLADSYGYADAVDVETAVSALDVLVKAHELVFGEEFTAETCTDYLALNDYGYVTTEFSLPGSGTGFTVNDAIPNDGTESAWGGYNGTTITTTPVADGDSLAFFFYEDTSYYLDLYNWLEDADGYSRTIEAVAGRDLTLTMKAVYIMMGYMYQDCAEMVEDGAEAADVQLYTVDMETGELTAIGDAVTGEDGNVTLNFAEAGTYYVAGLATEDCDDTHLLTITQINVSEPVEETYEASFYGYSSFFDSFTVKRIVDGVVSDKDMLAGVSAVSSTWTTELPAGEYVVEGFKSNASRGSIVVEVKSDAENNFKLYAVTGIRCSTSGWTWKTDYTMNVTVSDKNMNPRTITLGEETGYYGLMACTIVLEGDTIDLEVIPAESHSDYLKATASKTITTNTSGLTASCVQGIPVSFQVPEGSTLSVGSMSKYYVYTFLEPTEENGTDYIIPKGTTCFYRVQNPNGVTYWNYASWNAAATVTVTEAQMYIGDSSFNKDTVFDNFEHNVYDMANIYLNVNAAGCKTMSSGDTFELNVFRTWMAIEGISNAKVALPDMHYQVINMDGSASDVVTVTPDAKNSSVATVTANHAGTAIVLVTYDAMTHDQGMTKAGNGDATKQYSAIWPENTGVFVVNVDGSGSVQTNMVMDRTEGKTTVLDSEHDILYYIGSEGASYSFVPESGATVTVNRSTVGSSMTFGGFTASGVSVAEDGTVTVSGLTTGRHIIRVEKNGAAAYQVVTARETSYDILTVNGETYTEDSEIKAGDTVVLQFHNMINSAEKMSGVYNFNTSLYYIGEEGSAFKSNAGGAFGVYDFSGNPARQQISITVPKYWGEDTYSLSGVIKMGGFGSAIGAHRGITYATGSNPNFTAENVGMTLSYLPEITFELAETNFLNCKVSFADENGNAIPRSAVTITMKDASGNGVTVAEDGSFTAVAETFSYTMNAAGYRYKFGSVAIDEENTEFTITLQSADEDTWDGITKTEPQKDENGVYQVGTGAELAYLASATTFSAVLTDDIDLGDYPWTAINNGTYTRTYTLDGQNHRIDGLNAVKGLFGTIGGSSEIKNLTIAGVINTTSGSAGAVVGYLQGGTVSHVINEVNITGTGASNKDFGGIAGYMYRNATIDNCINRGTITVEGKEVGGIVGYSMDGSGKVTNCYNTGDVTGESVVGGIIGSTTCAVENCYNVGTVTGGKAIAGSGAAKNIKNCYYLNTLAEDENAAALSETAMKSADLGDAFVLVCGTYPALAWEDGIVLHETEGEGTVVEPTCTEGGYTEHTCTKCGETYMDTYTDPAGHAAGSDLKVYPAYRTYTCSVCGEARKEWNDDRLEQMTLPLTLAENITMSDSGDYAWVMSEDGVLSSSNVDVNSSTSASSMTFTLLCNGTLSFDYEVSSEARYDKLTITLTPAEGSAVTIANAISGSETGTYSEELTAGTYTLTMSYTKDSSSKSGTDTGSVKNIKMTAAHKLVIDAAVAATCTDTGLTAGFHCEGCTLVGKAQRVVAALGHTEEAMEAVEATCTETGLTAGSKCSVCGEILTAQEEIPALGHTEEVVEAVEATCTATGLTEGTRCSVCGEILTAQEEIAKLDHTLEMIEKTEATCTEPETGEGVKCSICGEILVAPETTGEALGHTEVVLEGKAATCTETGLTEGKKCSVCDEILVAQEELPALGHNYVDVVTAPTAETEGYTTHACSRCGDSYTDTIVAKLTLTAPELVSAVNKKTGIAVTWKAVENAPKYRVYRKVAGGNWKRIGDTTSTTLIDTTAVSGTTYLYTVRCLSTDGSTVLSGFVKAGIEQTRLAETTLKVTKTTGGAKLTWTKVEGAEKYRVYRKTGSGTYSVLKTTSLLTFTDTTAEKGKTYTYVVKVIQGTATSSYTGVKIQY